VISVVKFHIDSWSVVREALFEPSNGLVSSSLLRKLEEEKPDGLRADGGIRQ